MAISYEEKQKHIKFMIEKSKDSFLLAIELYNKPTISLRIEGYLYFICLSWELLLKAKLMSDGKSIYFKDKGNRTSNKTISLQRAIEKLLSNENDNVRKNLLIINGVRNSATHLIIPEYANEMNDIFLACVRNYQNKLNIYFPSESSLNIKSDFLTLHLPSPGYNIDCVHKYGTIIENKFQNLISFIKHTFSNEAINNIVPEELAISYDIKFKRVSDVNEADLKIVNVKSNADVKAIKIVETVDASESHPYTRKDIIDKVCKETERLNIKYTPYTKNNNAKFNSSAFDLLSKHTKIKDDKQLCNKHKVGKHEYYTYSAILVQHIINILTNDSDIFIKIKKS